MAAKTEEMNSFTIAKELLPDVCNHLANHVFPDNPVANRELSEAKGADAFRILKGQTYFSNQEELAKLIGWLKEIPSGKTLAEYLQKFLVHQPNAPALKESKMEKPAEPIKEKSEEKHVQNLQTMQKNPGLVWIHCAIPDELKETLPIIQKAFSISKWEKEDQPIYHRFAMVKLGSNEFKICLSSNATNQHQGASTNISLNKISTASPSFIFMPGICGGNSDRVKIGDVVVSSVAIPDQVGSRIATVVEGSNKPEVQFHHDVTTMAPISQDTLHRAQDVEEWSKHVDFSKFLDFHPTINIGPTACSDVVHSDLSVDGWKNLQTELATKKVWAVECEAIHLYRLFPRNSLMAKGVQDLAFKKEEDTKKYRQITAQLSVSYVARFIQEHLEWILQQKSN